MECWRSPINARSVALAGAMNRRVKSPRRAAKQLTIWVMTICMVGCTTLSSIDGTPLELQRRIAAGALLEPGERVVIDTRDGATHDLFIRSIRDGIIHGEHAAIAIEAIVSIQKRELSVGKTVGLVGGLVGGLVLGALTWLAIDVCHAGPRVCSK